MRRDHGGTTHTQALDQSGFADVRFRGRYPVGHMELRDDDCPVEVYLDASSPLVPANPPDSSLPAAVFEYTLRNRSRRAVDLELLGLAVTRSASPADRAAVLLTAIEIDGAPGLLHGAVADDGPEPERPDIVFEDWERTPMHPGRRRAPRSAPARYTGQPLGQRRGHPLPIGRELGLPQGQVGEVVNGRAGREEEDTARLLDAVFRRYHPKDHRKSCSPLLTLHQGDSRNNRNRKQRRGPGLATAYPQVRWTHEGPRVKSD